MRNILVRLMVTGAIAGTLGLAPTAHAGKAGQVSLLVPAPSPPIAFPQKVVVIGGAMANVTIGTDCGAVPGTYPLQSVVIVDPRARGAGGHGRFTNVIVLFPAPFKPGTRLGQIVNEGPCTVGSTPYQRITGIVE